MQFVVVNGSWPVSPYEVPRSQLMTHSVKDAHSSSDHSMLPGGVLVTLCQEVLNLFCPKGGDAPVLGKLDMTFLRDPRSGPLGTLRIYTPKAASQQHFAVENIVGSGCLVMFMPHMDSLLSAAELTGMMSARKERETSSSSPRRRLETTTTDNNSGSSKHSKSNSMREVARSKANNFMGRGRSALQKFTRAETYFTSVASATQADFDAVNELIMAGTIRIDTCLESFLCNVCGNLPRQTMTTSCCGAVVCSMCAPTLPSSVLREDVVCAVCGEIPITNPDVHVSRDAEVVRLVRELRVLYHPHISAAAPRALLNERQPQPPPPFTMHHSALHPPTCDIGGPASSVLGSIFMGPS